MRKEGLPLQRLMSNQAMSAIAAELQQQDVSALYAAVGDGRISPSSIVRRLVAAAGGVDGAADDVAEAFTPTSTSRAITGGDPGVIVKGTSDVWVKLARCCTPGAGG